MFGHFCSCLSLCTRPVSTIMLLLISKAAIKTELFVLILPFLPMCVLVSFSSSLIFGEFWGCCWGFSVVLFSLGVGSGVTRFFLQTFSRHYQYSYISTPLLVDIKTSQSRCIKITFAFQNCKVLTNLSVTSIRSCSCN